MRGADRAVDPVVRRRWAAVPRGRTTAEHRSTPTEQTSPNGQAGPNAQAAPRGRHALDRRWRHCRSHPCAENRSRRPYAGPPTDFPQRAAARFATEPPRTEELCFDRDPPTARHRACAPVAHRPRLTDDVRPPTLLQGLRRFRRVSGHSSAPAYPDKAMRAITAVMALIERMSGGVLLSHPVSRAVPSAQRGLASGFGMGPGVSPSLWPPKLYGVVVNRP